jgi:GMP synthase (glutamine-hydrolysing)
MTRAVLIQHGSDGPANQDRASARLAQLGYELDWRHVDKGDPLDQPDGSIAITVIYGGSKPEDEKDWHTDRYPWLRSEVLWARQCIARNIPTVGFCLGGQIIAHALGSTIGPHRDGIHEFGYYPLTLTEDASEFFPEEIYGTESHYHGFTLPKGATLLATTDHFLQAFSFGKTTYGFQFHPECTRENFKRWQVSDSAAYGQPGAQTKLQQDLLGDRYDAIQADWLNRFLTELVPPLS